MFKLRDYQKNIIDSIRAKIRANKKLLVYAPTGAGKTKMAQFIIEKIIANKKTVLFTVPRIKLAMQTQKSFGFGNLILGDKTVHNNSLCTIASLQSLYTRKINTKFDYIFIDECHYSFDSEYQKYIFKTYPNAYFIGLSATPIDENGFLLQGYNDIVNEITVKELIKQKYLCDVEVYTSKIQPNTKELPVINGDYNMEEASKLVTENTILSNAISEWQKLARNKKTLVFACDINHATELVSAFKAINANCDAVHSKMNPALVEKSYSDFNRNKTQVLINVDMATFGFNQPDIECLLFVRPIRSLRLYKQMVGRGLRTAPNKDKCLILDCANVIYDNGFPTDEIAFKKKPIVNKTIDKILNIERDVSGKIKSETISKERIEYLEKIGSLVDLYANKVYHREQDLVDDCKVILKRAGFFMWRQNSGRMFKDGRWVHFTDKNGLPDVTLIYYSVYIGLELKLPQGRLTKHQKETLPEMAMNKVHFFIIENVIDLFESLEIVQKNIVQVNDGDILIKKDLFDLSESQKKYREKYNLL